MYELLSFAGVKAILSGDYMRFKCEIFCFCGRVHSTSMRNLSKKAAFLWLPKSIIYFKITACQLSQWLKQQHVTFIWKYICSIAFYHFRMINSIMCIWSCKNQPLTQWGLKTFTVLSKCHKLFFRAVASHTFQEHTHMITTQTKALAYTKRSVHPRKGPWNIKNNWEEVFCMQ